MGLMSPISCNSVGAFISATNDPSASAPRRLVSGNQLGGALAFIGPDQRNAASRTAPANRRMLRLARSGESGAWKNGRKIMYQIKCSSGNEIQVIGKGENGLCRVVSSGVIINAGTYDECVAWCAARAIKVDVPSGNRTDR